MMAHTYGLLAALRLGGALQNLVGCVIAPCVSHDWGALDEFLCQPIQLVVAVGVCDNRSAILRLGIGVEQPLAIPSVAERKERGRIAGMVHGADLMDCIMTNCGS